MFRTKDLLSMTGEVLLSAAMYTCVFFVLLGCGQPVQAQENYNVFHEEYDTDSMVVRYNDYDYSGDYASCPLSQGASRFVYDPECNPHPPITYQKTRTTTTVDGTDIVIEVRCVAYNGVELCMKVATFY